MFLCVHVTPVRNTATVHRDAAAPSTPPHSLRRWRWISLRTTSLLQPSDMPLSANPEPAPPHTHKGGCQRVAEPWRCESASGGPTAAAAEGVADDGGAAGGQGGG